MPKAERVAFITAAITAAAARYDIVIFPELCVTGWDNARDDAEAVTGPTVTALCAAARAHGVACVIGMAELARPATSRCVMPLEGKSCGPDDTVPTIPESIAPAVFNTTVFVSKTGTVLLRHRKTHPYDAFEKKVFTCGGKVSDVVPFMGFRVGIACCFELEHPEYVRSLRLRGADFILAPSACADDFVVHRMVSTRAFENSCFVAYVNCVGFANDGTVDLCFQGGSSLAGPDGRDVLRMPYVEASTTDVPRLKVPTMVSGEDWVNWTTEPRDDAFHAAFAQSTAETVPFDAVADGTLRALPVCDNFVLRGVALPGRGFSGAVAHLAGHMASAPYMSSRRPWLYDGCTTQNVAVENDGGSGDIAEVPFNDEDVM
jgi:predicted amidohydrolase